MSKIFKLQVSSVKGLFIADQRHPGSGTGLAETGKLL